MYRKVSLHQLLVFFGTDLSNLSKKKILQRKHSRKRCSIFSKSSYGRNTVCIISNACIQKIVCFFFVKFSFLIISKLEMARNRNFSIIHYMACKLASWHPPPLVLNVFNLPTSPPLHFSPLLKLFTFSPWQNMKMRI